MWMLRFLNSPQVGQLYPLTPGQHLVGRGPQCSLRLLSNGVSKEHATIEVSNQTGEVELKDLKSRNGSFVNGVKIKSRILSKGDKVLFHDVMLEVISATTALVSAHHHSLTTEGVSSAPAGGFSPTGAGFSSDSPASGLDPISLGAEVLSPSNSSTAGLPAQNFQEKIIKYTDEVIMPGIDVIAKRFDMRVLLALIALIFITTVIVVAAVPTTLLLRQAVEDESRRRAIGIARHLAAMNKQAILEKNDIALTTRTAEIEDGVITAQIINAVDGSVLAPASQRGKSPDRDFLKLALKSDKEMDRMIGSDLIGASVPIVSYNSELREPTPTAYAVIIYSLDSISIQKNSTLGMFIQVFGISLIFGIMILIVLYRIVENPIRQLNSALDEALRERRTDVSTDYLFPQLTSLASNISSLLARVDLNPQSSEPIVVNREKEAENVIRLIAEAAIAINALDNRVIIANTAFDRLIGGGAVLQGREVYEIPDTALQQNLLDAVPQLRNQIDQLVQNEIPFLGIQHVVRGQAVAGIDGQAAYYIFTIRPIDAGDSGGGA